MPTKSQDESIPAEGEAADVGNRMKRGSAWLTQLSLVGSRVRVETGGAVAPLVGVVVEANTDSFLIQGSGQGSAVRVTRDDVVGLEVSHGYRRRTAEGILGGASQPIPGVGRTRRKLKG